MQSGEGSHGQKLFNVSGKVRMGNWTALDHLPSAGGPLLQASVLTLQHSFKEAALGNCLTSSCWEIVFSLCCDVEGELNLQELFLPVV